MAAMTAAIGTSPSAKALARPRRYPTAQFDDFCLAEPWRDECLRLRVIDGEVRQLSAEEPTQAAGDGLQREGTMAKYGKSASKSVKSAMHRKKKGTLKSSSGRKVKSRK